MARLFRATEALAFLDELAKKFTANQGKGLSFLVESSTSPSRARLQKIFAKKFPKAQWFTYDAVDSGIHQRTATQTFSQPVRPIFHFEKAKVILSLDCDFIGGEDDAHNNIAGFVKGRKVENGGMNRLYAVESLFTLTGAERGPPAAHSRKFGRGNRRGHRGGHNGINRAGSDRCRCEMDRGMRQRFACQSRQYFSGRRSAPARNKRI